MHNEESMAMPEAARHGWSTMSRWRRTSVMAMRTKPWRQWVVIFSVPMIYCFISRCVGLDALLQTFGAQDEHTLWRKLGILVLGSWEDFVLMLWLVSALWLCDSLLLGPSSAMDKAKTHQASRGKRFRMFLRRIARIWIYFVLLLVSIAPFAADILLLRMRNLRFTFDYLFIYVRDMKFAASLPVSKWEEQLGMITGVGTLWLLVVLWIVIIGWINLAEWNPFAALLRQCSKCLRNSQEVVDSHHEGPSRQVSLEDGFDSTFAKEVTVSTPPAGTPVNSAPYESMELTTLPRDKPQRDTVASSKCKRAVFTVLATIVVLITASALSIAISHAVPIVIAASAMNNSLNELFRLTLGVELQASVADGTIESAAFYLDNDTEEYTLFRDDVLYRKTTGFKGPLAFNVSVERDNLPNVLVVVVESFRNHDSLYLVGNNSVRAAKKHNISLTPNFDRYAARGIAFSNFWSSWVTSRSIESVLFGQVPYDSPVITGTCGGRRDTVLAGMPQLFHAKGYENTFTMGARSEYDDWKTFLLSHGFDDLVGAAEMKKLAEQSMRITPSQWEDRGFMWGVHDDVSFEILGDLIVNKTTAQRNAIANATRRTPFFINHYTISSHTPFYKEPDWFKHASLPDFSPLYKDYPEHAKEIQRYARLRYFEDMELGRFLDRMNETGVLNDTIVVITGDHGQSPEGGLGHPSTDQLSTTRVAALILAEGRLGNHSGLIMHDAAEHYDLLNTLADIVGVPDGGFLQTGVGRSLKRAAPFGQRIVWSNNPEWRMAAVRGHDRFAYDHLSRWKALYDAETDLEQTEDQLPSKSRDEQATWEQIRRAGQRLNVYFKTRWKHHCMAKVSC